MVPMMPGVLPVTPNATPISRLSPSQYGVLTECALRASWSAAREPALLPAPPTARLGSAIHALLEEAGRGILGDCDAKTVRAAWDRLVAAVEGRMNASWLERSLVPLQVSVRDYDVRRIRAERKAATLASEAPLRSKARGLGEDSSEAHASASFETWVASRDGSVGGYIDRVRETPDGPVLVDYKSGTITEKGTEATVKESYQTQLKLYAALYAETFGQWPVGLEIVPMEGMSQAVLFAPDACLTLLNETHETLVRINRAIAQSAGAARRTQADEWLANPHPLACNSCPYRPVCGAYHRARPGDDNEWPVDVWGRVASIQPLGNNRTGLTLVSESGATMRVRSLCRSSDRHPALGHIKTGDHIAAYNLDGRHASHTFAETSLTVLYRRSDGDTL